MRGLRSALAFAAFLAGALAAQAQVTVSHYGFDFPLKIGALIRGDVTNFEKDNPGVGYGIRYAAAGTRVDIFVYDLGKRSISSDIFHADQKQEFESSVQAVHRAKERGLYRDVKEGREFESPAAKNPFFRCKAFVIDRGEGRLEDSAICLGAQNDKFFKVRISFTPPAGQIPERSDKLLRDIARAVKF